MSDQPYVSVPCPDCERPVKVPLTPVDEDDDTVECGNCGAIAAREVWLEWADDE